MAGALAAEHLLLRGHKHFVFIGYEGLPFSEGRQCGFQDRLRQADRSCDVFVLGMGDRQGRCGLGFKSSALRKIGDWLTKKRTNIPLALFAANDALASLVQKAAGLTAMSIPGDIALLGMDDSSVAAAASLSSVVLPHALTGRFCAKVLLQMFEGSCGQIPQVPVLDVHQRLSTHHFVGDAELLKVLQERLLSFHREETVDSLAHALQLSSRQLNRRLRACSDTTAVRLLRRARLAQARLFLDSSGAELETVAQQAGFGTRQGMGKAFREEYGLKVEDFRRVQRGRLPNAYD